MSAVKKVVLAYSGGLDTSVIVKWLQEEYNCEVVTFTADIGQGEEVEPARAKAEALGVKEIYIDDLREEYARDFVSGAAVIEKKGCKKYVEIYFHRKPQNTSGIMGKTGWIVNNAAKLAGCMVSKRHFLDKE